LECLQIGYASFAETLTGKQADFDLGLIQPASMRGRVVYCEAIPDPVSRSLAVVAVSDFRRWMLRLSTTR
jgi:hypothetical protein